MPIKFACPKCKNVMTVADSMAGKKGKCKCGQAVQVPTPKKPSGSAAGGQPAPKPASQAAAGQAPPPAIGGALDQLTESDFGRSSPFENVYNPKKATGDSKQLEKFQTDEDKKKIANKGKLTGGLIFIAILNFIHSLAFIALAVIVFAAATILAAAEGQMQILALGASVIAAISGVFAALLIAGGVGILMKQKFGWFITATYYVILMCDRIMNVVNVIIGGFEQIPFFGALTGLLITFALMSYVLSGNSQEVFKIKTSVPLIVVLILGIAIGGGIAAAGYMADKAEDEEQAQLPTASHVAWS